MVGVMFRVSYDYHRFEVNRVPRAHDNAAISGVGLDGINNLIGGGDGSNDNDNGDCEGDDLGDGDGGHHDGSVDK